MICTVFDRQFGVCGRVKRCEGRDSFGAFGDVAGVEDAVFVLVVNVGVVWDVYR